jgi:hypothetical protein
MHFISVASLSNPCLPVGRCVIRDFETFSEISKKYFDPFGGSKLPFRGCKVPLRVNPCLPAGRLSVRLSPSIELRALNLSEGSRRSQAKTARPERSRRVDFSAILIVNWKNRKQFLG